MPLPGRTTCRGWLNLTRLRKSVGDRRRCVEVFLHLHTNRGFITTPRERHSLHALCVGRLSLDDPATSPARCCSTRHGARRQSNIPLKTKVWNSAPIKREDLDTIGGEALESARPPQCICAEVVGKQKAVTCADSQSDPSGPRRAERMVALSDALDPGHTTPPVICHRLRCLNSVKTTTTDCGSAFQTSLQ